MPIQGFIRPRLARLGKIRLGKKSVSARTGNDYPDDLTCFRVPEEVAAIYGDEPTELDVMVPSADIDKFFPTELQRWGTGEQLLCRGDGETARRWDDERAGWQEIDCGYQECPFYGPGKGKGCTERGALMVFLPKVSLSGVYQIDTGSFYGVNNVYSEFTTFQTMLVNLTGNTELIRAVRFKLTREIQVLNYFDGTTRKSVSKALLHLRAPNLSEEAALQLATHFRGGINGPLLGDGSTIPAPELGPGESELPLLPDGELPGEVLDECAPDLVAGASPEGADLDQKAAWATLLEQVAELGYNADVAEKSVCRMIDPEAVRIDDIAAEQVPDAIERLTAMIQRWQEGVPVDDTKAAPAAAPPKTDTEVAKQVTRQARPSRQQAAPAQREQRFPPTSKFTEDGQAVPVGPGGGNGGQPTGRPAPALKF